MYLTFTIVVVYFMHNIFEITFTSFMWFYAFQEIYIQYTCSTSRSYIHFLHLRLGIPLLCIFTLLSF
uniref:Uncharacterized protein n=1 Tax=Lepeophtheirus salmonis TaxID=72036 RepID=A0A0K2TIA7_LEPSM